MNTILSRAARFMSNMVEQTNLKMNVLSTRTNDGMKFASAARLAAAAIVVGVTALSIYSTETSGVRNADPIGWGKTHILVDGDLVATHKTNELASTEINPEYVNSILSCMNPGQSTFGMSKDEFAFRLAKDAVDWSRRTRRDINVAFVAYCIDPGAPLEKTISRLDKKRSMYQSDSLIGEMAEKHLRDDAIVSFKARSQTIQKSVENAKSMAKDIYNDGYTPGSKIEGAEVIKVADLSSWAGAARSIGNAATSAMGINSSVGSAAGGVIGGVASVARAATAPAGSYGGGAANIASAAGDLVTRAAVGVKDMDRQEQIQAAQAKREAEAKARMSANDPATIQKNSVAYKECLQEAAKINADRAAAGKAPLPVSCDQILKPQEQGNPYRSAYTTNPFRSPK